MNDDELEALIHERTDVPCLHLGVTVECEGEEGERFGAWDKTLFLFRHKQRVSYQQHIDVLDDGKCQLTNLTNKGHAGTLLFLTLLGEDLMFHNDHTSILSTFENLARTIGFHSHEF